MLVEDILISVTEEVANYEEAVDYEEDEVDDQTRPQTRVMPEDYGELPAIKKPASAPWDMIVPHSELNKLLNGFRPKDMDDHWFIISVGPDAQGNLVVHMHRSWTSYKIFEVKVQVPLDEHGQPNEEDSTITEVTWESYGHEDTPEDEDEADAKDTVELLSWKSS
ncbi:hypothetical protein GQ53DRAFT_743767 [Thozetella sp. PMI_491]|nr:hypothetical protein GQ53DRAFT_743767 [Thozetella sp. PMI_491]